jgi:hypothetical protein
MSQLHAELCERYGDDFADFDIDYDAPIPFWPTTLSPNGTQPMKADYFAKLFARIHGQTADQFFNDRIAQALTEEKLDRDCAHYYAAGAMKASYDDLRTMFRQLLAEHGQTARKLAALELANYRVLDDKTAEHVDAEAAEILDLDVPTLEEVEASHA